MATGNRVLVAKGALAGLPALPASLSPWVQDTSDWREDEVSAVLFSGPAEDMLALSQEAAERTGSVVSIHKSRPDGRYSLEWLVLERSVSTNTTAAGGNANLMMIG